MSSRDRAHTVLRCRPSAQREWVRFRPSRLPTSFELVRTRLNLQLRSPLPALRGSNCLSRIVLLAEFHFRRKRTLSLKLWNWCLGDLFWVKLWKHLCSRKLVRFQGILTGRLSSRHCCDSRSACRRRGSRLPVLLHRLPIINLLKTNNRLDNQNFQHHNRSGTIQIDREVFQF